jgi:hypothetical protein
VPKTREEGSNTVASCNWQASASFVIWRSIPMRAMHHAMTLGAARLASEKAAAVPLIDTSRRPLT